MSDSQTTQMQKVEGDGAPAATDDTQIRRKFSDKEVNLLKRTICEGATDEELSMFIQNCKRYGLDPFTGQIHAVKRKGEMQIQVGIDGFRLIADRTGKWRGTTGPYWCDESGDWTDVWLKDSNPAAAKVGVLRSDFDKPRWGIARWEAYVATKGGSPMFMWKKMPAHMLAKCAEALALRSAFPNDLSGLYTDAEMDQAGDSDKRTYDGPDPQEVDAEVVENGSSKTVGNTHGSEEDPNQDQPDYDDRLRKIEAWLDAKPPEELGEALQTVEQKIEDWPEDHQRRAREVSIKFAAVDLLHKNGPEAEGDIQDWVMREAEEHELSQEATDKAWKRLEEEAEAMRPSDAEEATEAMMDGETALDPSSEDDSDETPSEEGGREYDSHKAALEGMCPTALQQGKLNHIPEEERISSEKESPDDTTQLGRLFRIAYQEEGWEESWVDRLIKDELGYESKKHIPKGEAYDQIVQALRSDEMRFWMSRDPDTPDMFEDNTDEG